MNKNDVFPSKYLKAADLDGKPALFVIASVVLEELQDQNGKSTQKPCIYFQNQEKGMVCNVTNWDVIADFLGDESDDWAGKEIVLYPERVRDPKGGMTWGIRVREPKNRTAATARTKKAAAPAPTENPADGMDDDIPF